ncbi:MAG: GTPase [Planctomycetota bacterium]|nr:GTPase [Planctomycetota bacterium]
MRSDDTIVALASGSGAGPRALVRVSGPATDEVLKRLLGEAPEGRGVRRCRFADAVAGLPCLVVRFEGPRSYTGQHAAELTFCGGAPIVDAVLHAALAIEGVRAAGPGEFTARAFLAGLIPLDEAEAVQGLIAARSRAELAAARRMSDGTLGRMVREVSEWLLDVLARVEAGIDFTDQEDVVAVTPAQVAHSINNCAFGLGCFHEGRSREAAERTPRVVFAGAPSAGKSTLFNALLGARRSLVSAAPGTTRDPIAQTVEMRELAGGWGGSVTLIDPAGLDEALAGRGEVDALAQRAARREIEAADVVVLCDPGGRFRLPGVSLDGKPVVRVRTKADLPGGGDAVGALAVCAIDGWGIGTLRRAIADAAGAGLGSGTSSWRAGPRQARAVAAACAALERARALLSDQLESPRLERAELIAGELRAGLDALGELTGRVHPDDVLGRVFSSFCIGK